MFKCIIIIIEKIVKLLFSLKVKQLMENYKLDYYRKVKMELKMVNILIIIINMKLLLFYSY